MLYSTCGKNDGELNDPNYCAIGDRRGDCVPFVVDDARRPRGRQDVRRRYPRNQSEQPGTREVRVALTYSLLAAVAVVMGLIVSFYGIGDDLFDLGTGL